MDEEHVELELDEELTALQKDEEKLKLALQEYDDDWDYASEDEEDEDGRYIIDLDRESSDLPGKSVQSGVSTGSPHSSAGSVSHSKQGSLHEDEEIVGAGGKNELSSTLLSTCYNDDDLGSATVGAADPEKALALNRALQGILEGHIEAIQEAIEKNNETQAQLEEDLPNTRRVGVSTTCPLRSAKSLPFRAPYFRIGNEYPEPNEDVKTKKRLGHARLSMPAYPGREGPLFNGNARQILRQSVLEDYSIQMIKPLMARHDAEVERRDKVKARQDDDEIALERQKTQLKLCDDLKERIEIKFHIHELEQNLRDHRNKLKEHNKTISVIEKEMEEVKNIGDEEEILNSLDPEKIDWLRISKMNFAGKISWVDCQKAWNHFVDPKVFRGMWTPEERSKLNELVSAAGSESWHADWTQVAKDLGTGRTAFQCMSYYQRNFNPDILPKTWTPEEDAKLVSEANKIRELMGFYHWKKISLTVENRSAADCSQRFNRINPNTSRGKFTPEEDAKILAGIEMYGLRYGKIARFLGTRSNSQVRDRYLESLNPENNYMSFTYDEDLKLLKLYKQYGNGWSKIAEHFSGRPAPRLLSRYNRLMRWKAKKEWFDHQPNDVKAMLLGKTLPAKEKSQRMGEVREHIINQLGINMDDYRRQTLDRNNGVDPDIIPPRPPFITTYKPRRRLTHLHATSWSKKLNFHDMLSKNVRQLMERDAKKRAGAGLTGKLPTILEEENKEEIFQEAISATIRAQRKEDSGTLSKRAVNRAEAILTKAFHGGHTVLVSNLLETFKGNKKDQQQKTHGKMQKMDALLRKAIRPRQKLNQRGKARMFFSQDLRDVEVIEAEKKELLVEVPDLITKAFGTSLLKLYQTACRKHLELQTKLKDIPNFQEDEELMAEEAKLVQRYEVEELESRLLDSKIQKLHKIYRKKYQIEEKKLKDLTRVSQRDVSQLHLKISLKDPELTAQLGPVWLDQKEELAPEETETTRSGRSSRRRSLGETGEKRRPKSQLGNMRLQCEQRGQEQQDGEHDAFKVLSISQIEEEQRRLDLLAVKITSAPSSPSQSEAEDKQLALPCLPPTMTSLCILKSLLLQRGRLMQQAEPLAKVPELKDMPQKKGKLFCIERPPGGDLEQNPLVNLVVGGGEMVQSNQPNVEVKSFDKAAVEACVIPRRQTREDFDYLQEEPRGLTNRRARHKDFIVSHPDFNVANFSMRNDRREGAACLQPAEVDTEGSQSSYELVVAPTSNAIPDYLDQEGQKVASVGSKGENSSGKRKQSVEVEDGGRKPKSVKLSVTQQNIDTRKPKSDMMSQSGQVSKDNRRGIRVISGMEQTPATTVTTTTSAKKPAPAAVGSRTKSSNSREHFEFPTLFNTGKEVIEIVEGSSSDEEDITIVSKDASVQLGPDLEAILETTSKNAKEVFQRTGMEGKRTPNIVVVGLADSGHVVHHKVGKDRMLKTVETKMSCTVEDTDKYTAAGATQVTSFTSSKPKEHHVKNEGRYESRDCSTGLGRGRDGSVTLGSWKEMLKQDKLLRRRASMHTIRNSTDYKMLRARLRSLLLWPVLTSIVKPVKNAQLETMFREDQGKTTGEEDATEAEPEAEEELPIRWNRKLSKSERRKYHLQSAKYRRSQFMQQKRSERKKFKAAVATMGEENSSAVAAVVETQSEPVGLEDVTLAFPPEGTAQTNVKKKGRGRPKGTKNQKKMYPPPKERPQRERKQPERMKPSGFWQPKENTPRVSAVQIPQWWKDAMLAAMMVRRDMDMNKAPGNEVAIEDDEEFQDRGDYSDDDWEQGLQCGENEKGNGQEWTSGCAGRVSGASQGQSVATSLSLDGQNVESGQEHDEQSALNGQSVDTYQALDVQSAEGGKVCLGQQNDESGQGLDHQSDVSGQVCDGQSGDNVRLPAGQGGDSGQVPAGQGGDSGQVPAGQSGDSGQVPAGHSGQVPAGQSGDSGQVPAGQSGDSGQVPAGQSGDSCQVIDGNEA